MAKTLAGAASPTTDSPLAGDNIQGYLGKLFVIEPLEVEKGLTTVNSKNEGDTTATRANVWVLRSGDGKKFEEFEDILIFQRVLQGQLRKHVGKGVTYGRLAQGEKKPGKNAPWILAEPTEKDTAAATAFWNSRSLAPATSKSDEPEDDGDAF